MPLFIRALKEHRFLWRIWLPLLLLTVAQPPLALLLPLLERHLIDGVVLARRIDGLLPTIGLYAGVWLAVTTVQVAGGLLRTYLTERMGVDIRRRLFAHCDALALAFSQREHSARTMTLFVSDAPVLAGLGSSTLLGGVASVLTVLIATSFMFGLNWQLALIVGIVPPLVAGAAAVITRPLRPAAKRVQEKAAELNERLQENLAGIREVVAYGRERSQGTLYGRTLGELTRLRMRLTYMDTAFQTGQTVFSLTVTLVMLGYGGYLVLQGQITLGSLFAVRTLFSYVFGALGQLFGLVSGLQRSLASAERVYGFLDEEPRVRELAGAQPPRNVSGEVAFEGVSFGYSPERTVLRDVSFTARPGEVVALVGPSGAGKSTLASLIVRFYDPTAGCVRLDGVDVRSLTLEGLRRQTAVVFQDTFLFATTVRENIAFGNEAAPEDAVVAAARAAHAWEFIKDLPKGLDTQAGQRGVQLSEGQKQRLAIARALLRDPRILILDEPTSALDARSEHLLQAALETLMAGRTTFVIAHRLATVERADRILVLEGGRVVEQGTHAELLRGDGLYRELHDLQFGRPAFSAAPVPALPHGAPEIVESAVGGKPAVRGLALEVA